MANTNTLLDKAIARLIVPPGKQISLKKDYEPGWKFKGFTKKRSKALLADGVAKLAEFQDKLYAQDRWGVLIIFQAMDAAGKDGTIKHVMSGINPQGCTVHSFKAPSTEELDHDYLWRCYKALPARGMIGIYNRSYYEEVLVTKVHPEILDRQKLPKHVHDKKIYERRYEEICNFERYLTNNGILVLKFFLNVSRDEQKRRFLERIETPAKNWKFSASDAKERGCWNSYMKAYEDCFNATSTKNAPWYVVPADDKPFMRVAVAGVIYKKLKELNLDYPKVGPEQKAQLDEALQILKAEK
jgi:PPK2 family polyphosphate:nucleotide phosphotransferase